MASLLKNVASQSITFVMVTTAGAAATGKTITGFVSKDIGPQGGGGTQAGTAGTFQEMGNGQYNYTPTIGETNAVDVGFLFTATGCVPVNLDFHTDPGNFNIFSIDATGAAAVSSNVKKNQAHNGFMFPLTDSTTHQLKPGVTFSAGQSQRALDGSVFANTANLPTEVGNGVYTINFNGSDTNGNNVAFLATPSGCDPTLLIFPTQP